MNPAHLSEIRNYLLSKKLPIDILMEVEDHFVAQINELQNHEQLDFNQAFEKTKNSWHRELNPYWNGSLGLEDVSDFMRKVRKENEISNLLFALKWSVLPLIMIFAGLLLFDAEKFGIFTVSILIAMEIAVFINYLHHYQDFKLVKKYPNYTLTWHQHSIFIFIIILSPTINILESFLNSPEKYQNFLLLKGSVSEFIFTLLPILLLIFGSLFSYSSQKNYLRQIQKVKPYLKNLKLSN